LFQRTNFTIKVAAIAVVPLLAAGVILTACSDSSDDSSSTKTPVASSATTVATTAALSPEQQAVETAVKGAVAAYNSANTEAFLKYWTDDALQGEFGVSSADIKQNSEQFFSDSPPGGISLGDFKSVKVTGQDATADFNFVFGQTVSPVEYTFKNQGGTWVIQDTKHLKAEIPSGTTAIDTGLKEFAFNFDKTAIKNGNIAFKVTNNGQQQHEMVIAQVPAGFTIDQLLNANPDEPPPAGVEIIGAVDPLGPGDSNNLVFSKPLAPGHYKMVCFLPDTSKGEDGPPHAAEGMVAQFDIP
jgi:hypothetical protein